MQDLISKVREFAEQNDLLSGPVIVVGLSGGPDSIFLLSFLMSEYKGRLIACHVNHNLRPGDAEADEKFVRDFCREHSVELRVGSADVRTYAAENGRSEEEAGRILRYEIFNRIGREASPDYLIAVAHHKGDLAETMLMNLFRGAGLEGLVSPGAKTGRIIRPLLSVSKQEITEYLEAKDIPYVTDLTNLESGHMRNKYRNIIIPAIREISVKDPEEALWDTYKLLEGDLDYIRSVVDARYPECKGNAPLTAAEPFPVASRIIRRMWNEHFGNMTNLEKVNVDAALDFLKAGRSGHISMPFDRALFMAGDHFGLCDLADLDRSLDDLSRAMGFVLSESTLNIPLKAEFAEKIPKSDIEISTEIIENIRCEEYNNYSWFYPVGKFEGLTLRNGIAGLEFRKAGSSGGKKLRRIFTDLKVPAGSRDRIVGITRGDEVLYVPGIGHADGFTDEASSRFFDSRGRYVRVSLENVL